MLYRLLAVLALHFSSDNFRKLNFCVIRYSFQMMISDLIVMLSELSWKLRTKFSFVGYLSRLMSQPRTSLNDTLPAFAAVCNWQQVALSSYFHISFMYVDK
jgi:hypothetical protein